MRMKPGWMMAGVVLAALLACEVCPWALAFPHQARIGATTIYAEAPIPPRIREIVARADGLVSRSAVWAPDTPRQIYLTKGGWRWRLLALQSSGAFGLRRPFLHAIVLNRSDVARDRIVNGRDPAGVRTLSGVIAHETTHMMAAFRLGEVRAALMPNWKREGYADYVAQESTLSDEEAARLRAANAHSRALDYYDYRKRVEMALADSGDELEFLRQ